jgi:hypothetical protein
MTAASWFSGYLVMMWLIGYGVGSIFLNLRKFVEKSK